MTKHSLNYAYADAMGIIAESKEPISFERLNTLLINKGYSLGTSTAAISSVVDSCLIKVEDGKLSHINI